MNQTCVQRKLKVDCKDKWKRIRSEPEGSELRRKKERKEAPSRQLLRICS
jgi:hypothetical protein